MPFPIRLLLPALAVLVLARHAEAQTRIPRCHSIPDSTRSMFEDRDGYLWIGLANGVLRFDGDSELFWPGGGLPAGSVWAIRQGQDGVLYFATERGASLRTGEGFKSPPPWLGIGTGRVRTIAPGPKGSLFFGHRHEVVKLHSSGRAERISLGLPAATRSTVHSLLWTKDGTLYAGTKGGDVVALRQGKLIPVPPVEGFRPGEIRAIHERRDGSLFFGTQGGLASLRDGFLQRPTKLRSVVNAIAEGRDGTLYVATHDGLWIGRGSPEQFEILTTGQGLPGNHVDSVLETRSGDVYIGTDRGLCVYQRDLIQSWTQEHGLPDRAVLSITSDAEGRIFAGTDRGLAVLQDGTWKLLGREHGIPLGGIHALQFDSDGALHLGMEGAYRGAYTLHRGLIREIPLPSPRGRGVVLATYRAPDGSFYLGGNGGLFLLRSEGSELLYDKDAVLAVDSSPDGSIWFGTWEHGLLRYKDGRFQSWTVENGLADNRVDSVTVGRDGRIYAGTFRGLSIFYQGRFRTLARPDGLTSDNINCALEDEKGLIYVHTDDGIGIVNPKGPSGSPVVLRNLSLEDGLVSRKGVPGACFRDDQGRFWFGGVRGVTLYHPRKEPTSKLPVPHLLGWQLFEERLPLPTRQAPRLSGRENYYLTFNFTGIDLATPHRVRYRYRLTGLDKDWSPPVREREVRYTNLGPGAYRFEMQTSNQVGRWSAPVTLPFKILPPPWWRRPFLMMSLSGGILLASPVLVAALRMRQLLAIERLRASLAAELHDHIGTGLTEIAIVSELAARRDGGASSELTQVGETARQLVDRMNDIVWLVNPRRDSLHELVTRLKSSYAELFATAGVCFETGDLSSLEGIHLSMTYRENLHALLKEALHNTLRHSGCSQVRLDVMLRGRGLEAIVRDNGRGFEGDREGGGNGLGNMRRRAAALGGRLTIESTSGQGTAIRFTGPIRGKRALDFRPLPW